MAMIEKQMTRIEELKTELHLARVEAVERLLEGYKDDFTAQQPLRVAYVIDGSFNDGEPNEPEYITYYKGVNYSHFGSVQRILCEDNFDEGEILLDPYDDEEGQKSLDEIMDDILKVTEEPDVEKAIELLKSMLNLREEIKVFFDSNGKLQHKTSPQDIYCEY